MLKRMCTGVGTWLQLLIIIMLIFAVVFSLVGCSGGAEEGELDPKNPVTITLWHYYSGNNHEMINAAIDEFNQSIGIEKGIVVDPIRMASILELETEAEKSAKGVVDSLPMPHIFSCYPDIAFKIDGHDKLVDMQEYFSEEELGSYVPDFLQDGYISGDRLLLIPVAKSTELLYLNDTAWEEFAADTGHTYDDLKNWESICDVAKDYYHWVDDKTPETPWDGKAMLGYDSVANFVVVCQRQMGVEAIQSNMDGTGQVVLNREVLRRIFDVYYPQTVLGYFGSYGEFRADDIKQGDIISYVASSSGASYFPTQVTDGNTLSPVGFKALPYPNFDESEHYAVQQGAGMCIAKSDPAHEQGAAEFLKWFTSKEQNLDFAMSTGYLPVQLGAYESDAVAERIEILRGGDESDQIIADVYDVSFNQIMNLSTYSAKPFDNSYNVRALMENELMELADVGFAQVEPMKEQGESAEEIMSELDLDAVFEEWMEQLKQALDEIEVEYNVE